MSAAISSMASSESDVVAVTISPARNSTLTTSAGDFPSFSAIVWGVAPRTNCMTGSAGLAGVNVVVLPGAAAAAGGVEAGAGPLAVAAGAAAGVGPSSVTAGSTGASGTALTAGLAAGFFGLRGAGGGSSTSRRLGVVAVAFPPLARSRGIRSSGTLDEADRPAAPICSRVATSSLLVTPSSFASS